MTRLPSSGTRSGVGSELFAERDHGHADRPAFRVELVEAG